MISHQDRNNFYRYEAMPDVLKEDVNGAIEAARAYLSERGYPTANDDRAAAFTAAVAAYVLDSALSL